MRGTVVRRLCTVVRRAAFLMKWMHEAIPSAESYYLKLGEASLLCGVQSHGTQPVGAAALYDGQLLNFPPLWFWPHETVWRTCSIKTVYFQLHRSD